MAAYEEAVDNLTTQLTSDVESVVIHTQDPERSYTIQKPILAGVSVGLAMRRDQKVNYLAVRDNTFRMFMGFILRRTIAHPGNEQEGLAQAWNFGESTESQRFKMQ